MWAHAVRPDVNFWEQLGTRVCSWFNADTGECSHYDIRPKECRDFENGSGDCVSMRRRMKIDSLVALTINGE